MRRYSAGDAFTFIAGALGSPGDKNDANGTFEGGFFAYPDVTGLDVNDLFTFEVTKLNTTYTGAVDISLLDISLGANNDIDDVYRLLHLIA